ncbi:MAG TPA: SigE family RNA polymerase sigma factor [Actinomycetota bacterium]|nr:SigE family RNA polymerase sigma factor [Actinomycetota bacterium]
MGTAEGSPSYAERTNMDRLGSLYEKHAPAATRLAYLLTGDRELARDLAQDAFIRVAGKFAALRAEGGFEAYLRSTIYNLVRSHFRHLKVERRHLEEQAGRTAPPDDLGPELRSDLAATLNDLPVRQRAAVVFRYYADLSEQHTADAMGCSVAAVRSLTFRALESLRITVDKEVST